MLESDKIRTRSFAEMTISEALRRATEELAPVSGENSRRDAAILLTFATGRDRTFQIAHPASELSERELLSFSEAVTRRLRHEPIQHITGRQEFYGLDFKVSPAVLIPRPETEIVVEEALSAICEKARPNILDLGTGSGCIVISILKNHETAVGIGVDISLAALQVAEQNALKLGVNLRLTLAESDLFAEIGDQRFDLIVSNPPYVPAEDISGLQPEVRDFEPHTALTDGGSGLKLIDRIIREAPGYLMPGGRLLIEMGYDQASVVAGMLDPLVWSNIRFINDLQGFPRVLFAERASNDFPLYNLAI